MTEREIGVLDETARNIRISIVSMIARAGSGHPGGSLSAADILTYLYFTAMKHRPEDPEWEDRDRFILSKGHAAPALYSVLGECGYFPRQWLTAFSGNGSPLQKHPDMHLVPGVEIPTGSLGQGLSVALGIAMDARLRKKDYRVYVIIGDGECDEGQIWEAAMAASHFNLDHLTVFLDHNGLQVDGTNREIMNLEPLPDKWVSFGWDTQIIDGHSMPEISSAVKHSWEVRNKPCMIIANTVKGKGVSFIENKVEWHARGFTRQEVSRALTELGCHDADLLKSEAP